MAVELLELVDEVLEVLVGGLDAGEVLVEAAVDELGDAVGLVVVLAVLGDVADVVARVVLHRDVKDELRTLLVIGVPEKIEDHVVGRLVGDAVVEPRRVVGPVVDVEEVVEAHLLVDGVAVPVGGQVGVHGRRLVALLLQLAGDVVHLGEVVHGVGVLARAGIEHRLAREGLELGVAGARARDRAAEVAAGERAGEALLEEPWAPVVVLQAVEHGQVGEGLVHDEDDRGLLVLVLRNRGLACVVVARRRGGRLGRVALLDEGADVELIGVG